ncbi:MAG: fumarate hydratase [Flavobacteriaceae bacterium]|nr:fumarate hydratase [Flavobacteriaceae bacterium]
MKYSVISGDIIASTELTVADKNELSTLLLRLIEELQGRFNCFGRLIKGDYIECVPRNPHDGLRVALAIKSFVKSISFPDENYVDQKNKLRLFKTYGIRLAIGYGPLRQFDPEAGVVDGEAIYLSGRAISGMNTHDKERVVIKNTLFFESATPSDNRLLDALMALLDVLFVKATARQSEVVYYKLMGFSEEEISEKLGINQSVVNQHSTSVGWNAIENAVELYSELFAK